MTDQLAASAEEARRAIFDRLRQPVPPPTVLRRVRLGPSHRQTGATGHLAVAPRSQDTIPDENLAPEWSTLLASLQGENASDLGFTYVPPPAELRIVSASSGEIMLLYMSEEGEELDHGHYGSVEDALRSAEAEFGVQLAEWEIVPEPS
jgi:hypothetical protein